MIGIFVFFSCSILVRSDASDHVATALADVTADNEMDRAKMVKSPVKGVKQLAMTVPHEAEIPMEDADASINGISVNASRATAKMLVVKETRRTVTMLPMAMHVATIVQESHASAHAIDQTRTEVVIR